MNGDTGISVISLSAFTWGIAVDCAVRKAARKADIFFIEKLLSSGIISVMSVVTVMSVAVKVADTVVFVTEADTAAEEAEVFTVGAE